MKAIKVLLADDEPQIALDVLEIFEKESLDNFIYTLHYASNGKLAYEFAIEGKPDLILMDWDMPEVNGIESVRLLKTNDLTNHIPIIMITGMFTDGKNMELAFKEGVIDYIRKPFDFAELLFRIHAVLKLVESQENLRKYLHNKLQESKLFIVKNNQFIDQLSKEMDNLELTKSKNISLLDKIKEGIERHAHENTWEHFDTSFKALHGNFIQNLSKKHSNLSKSESKLCSLLRLGMDTKEISSILCKTPESIKTARYRVRQKLKLKREQDLSTYLDKF